MGRAGLALKLADIAERLADAEATLRGWVNLMEHHELRAGQAAKGDLGCLGGVLADESVALLSLREHVIERIVRERTALAQIADAVHSRKTGNGARRAKSDSEQWLRRQLDGLADGQQGAAQ